MYRVRSVTWPTHDALLHVVVRVHRDAHLGQVAHHALDVVGAVAVDVEDADEGDVVGHALAPHRVVDQVADRRRRRGSGRVRCPAGCGPATVRADNFVHLNRAPLGTNVSTDLYSPRPSGTRSIRIRDCRPFSGKSFGSTVNVSPGRTPAVEPRLISTTPSGSFRRIFPCGSSKTNCVLAALGLRDSRRSSAALSRWRSATWSLSLRTWPSSRSRSSVTSVIFLFAAVSAAWYAFVRASNPSVTFLQFGLELRPAARSISFWNLLRDGLQALRPTCLHLLDLLHGTRLAASSAALYAPCPCRSACRSGRAPPRSGSASTLLLGVVRLPELELLDGSLTASPTPSFLAIAALILSSSAATILSPGLASVSMVDSSSLPFDLDAHVEPVHAGEQFGLGACCAASRQSSPWPSSRCFSRLAVGVARGTTSRRTRWSSG